MWSAGASSKANIYVSARLTAFTYKTYLQYSIMLIQRNHLEASPPSLLSDAKKRKTPHLAGFYADIAREMSPMKDTLTFQR